MEEKVGKLFLISGPSGVGKKTIISSLLCNTRLNIFFSISYTTRQKRCEEIHGLDYFFISEKEFEQKIESGDMLEYAYFFNNYYGTSKSFVQENLNLGRNVLLEIETKGFSQVISKMPETISIFILPPSIEELRNRLKKRNTECDHDVDLRIEKALEEISVSDQFDYRVVNDDLSQSIKEIEDIIFSNL